MNNATILDKGVFALSLFHFTNVLLLLNKGTTNAQVRFR